MWMAKRLIPEYMHEQLTEENYISKVNEFVESMQPNWQTTGTPVLTRRDKLIELKAEGIEGPLADVFAKKDAPLRAASRVARIESCAKAAVCEEDHRLFVWALSLLEARGVGGHQDASGDGTCRTPFAAAICGKGRRKASDGDAWSAALKEAGDKVFTAQFDFSADRECFVMPDLPADWEQEMELANEGLLDRWTLPLAGRFGVWVGEEIPWMIRFSEAVVANMFGPRHLRAEALRAGEYALRTQNVELAKKASRAYALFNQALQDLAQAQELLATIRAT